MIFKRLELYNWIPYKGHKKIQFSKGKKNVTIIRGNNKGGKSALLRGINWVLYGHTGDYKIYKENLSLLNREAFKEGDHSFHIKLIVEIDGDEILFHRAKKPKKGISTVLENDFEENFVVTKNGKPVPDPEKSVREIMDEAISRFFLFDGEMLQEYKNLVTDTKEAQVLKDHIEKVIRTPELMQARNDLNVNFAKLERKLQRQTKDKTHKQILKEIANLTDTKKLKEDELEGLKENLKETQENKTGIESNLRAYADTQQKIGTMINIRDNLPKLKKAIEKQEDIVKESTSEIWENVISFTTANELKKLETEKKKFMKVFEEEQKEAAQIETLQESYNTKKCLVCGERLDEDQLQKLKDKITVLYEKSEPLQGREKMVELEQKIKKMEPFRKPSLNRISRESAELIEMKDNLILQNQNLEALEKEVGKEEGPIGKIQTDLNNINLQENKLTESIEEIKKEIFGTEGLDQKISEARKFSEKFQSKDDANLDELMERYRNLIKTFEDSIKELSLKIKEEIQSTANDIHADMTVEDSTNKLEINDNFGLKVIDSSGNPIETSAGGNHIVALSLLYGLKQATDIEGPLVIDTPFSRIDLEHRELILNCLPNMGSQCVLLVHSGELEAGSDLESSIASKIGSIYEINKINDQVSEITKH